MILGKLSVGKEELDRVALLGWQESGLQHILGFVTRSRDVFKLTHRAFLT